MKLAILGTRGIPGNYGGFETFAEELSARLVERGHEVTVYCRTGNAPDQPATHRGVRLVHLPALRHKYGETISHTLLSAFHVMFRRYDVVYVCNSANAPICWILWLRRQRVVLNVDGLEWRRAKTRRSLPMEHIDRRDVDNIRRRVVNIEMIRRMLRWAPQVTLESGIQRTVEWFVGAGLAADAEAVGRSGG